MEHENTDHNPLHHLPEPPSLHKLTQEQEEAANNPIVRAFAAEVTKLRRRSRWIGYATIALIIISGTLGYLTWDQHNTDVQIKSSSIASCQSGNQFRADQTLIWHKYNAIVNENTAKQAVILQQVIHILTKGDANAEKEIAGLFGKLNQNSAQEINDLLRFIEHVDTPRNCVAAYSQSVPLRGGN